MRIGATFLELKQFQNGAWVSLPGDDQYFDRSLVATCASGNCVAVADFDGNGYADLVYLMPSGGIQISLTPTDGTYFYGVQMSSAIKAPTLDGNVLPQVTSTWEFGDIDGDGRPELVVPGNNGPSTGSNLAYYFDPIKVDFVPYPDPNHVMTSAAFRQTDAQPLAYPILPAGVGNGSVYGMGLMGHGSLLLQFQNNAGSRSINTLQLENSLSQNNELLATGYTGYLRFAKEAEGVVLTVRGPNGFLDKVQNLFLLFPSFPFAPPNVAAPLFVDSSILTTNGYPTYFTQSQQSFYMVLSNFATKNKNPDVRSLYAPGNSFGDYEDNIKTQVMKTYGGSTNLDADQLYVYNQTIAELENLQSVTDWYGATQTLFTNAYATNTQVVHDVEDVFQIMGPADIASQVLNDVTTALNLVGSLASFVSPIAGLATDVTSNVANIISASSGTFYLAGTISGDTTTYADIPAPDPSTGNYDLDLILSAENTGALNANTCSEITTMANWGQSAALASGVESGLFALYDKDTLQDIQSRLLKLTVWQTLAPTYWNIVAGGVPTPYNGPIAPFTGQPGVYEPRWTPLATCYGNDVFGRPLAQFVGMTFENISSSNFPNYTALQALFSLPTTQTPSAALGADPSAVLYNEFGWNFNFYYGTNGNDFSFPTKFEYNTSIYPFTCSSIIPLGTIIRTNNSIPAVSAAAVKSIPQVASPTASAGSPPSPSSFLQAVQSLTQQIPGTLRNPTLNARMSADLNVAYERLKNDVLFVRPPTDSVILLNDAITRLQSHTQLSPPPPDYEAALTALQQTVAVRNLLIGACGTDGAGCVVNTGN